MSLPTLLTVADVATYLGRSTQWVEREAQRGVLPGRKVGRQWRFVEADVQAYLDGAHVAKAQPRARRRRAS